MASYYELNVGDCAITVCFLVDQVDVYSVLFGHYQFIMPEDNGPHLPTFHQAVICGTASITPSSPPFPDKIRIEVPSPVSEFPQTLTLKRVDDTELAVLTKEVIRIGSKTVPVGSVNAFAGRKVPPGWLPCDGQAIERGKYQSLFGVIGNTYGPGDGSTTFNLPDLRGRTVIGIGRGDGLADHNLGMKDGEEKHVLTYGEMPIHDHGGNTDQGNPTSYRVVNAASPNSGVYSYANHTPGWASGNVYKDKKDVEYTMRCHTHNINPAGGSVAHNNMPPFIALNYIIKF
jgi:microcystin-dependent protein